MLMIVKFGIYLKLVRLFLFRFFQILKFKTFEYAVSISKCPQDIFDLEVYKFLVNSSYFYSIREFGLSLISSWLIIETMISLCIQKKLKDKSLLNNERRKELKESAISLQIDMAEITGIIDHERNLNIHKIRKARNDLIHKLIEPSEELCRNAFTIAREFVKEVLENCSVYYSENHNNQ